MAFYFTKSAQAKSPALREMDMPHLHEEYLFSGFTQEPLLLTLMRM